MNPKREQIIQSTCQLIEIQGYHATGIKQILAESEAPKGSLYYYFPDGKDELVEEAIDYTSKIIARRLQEGMDSHENATGAIPAFLRQLSQYVHESGYQAGGPITAVAMEAASTNERLNTACQRAYQQWQTIIETKLLADGFPVTRSRQLASVTIALIEGAIILSRTERTVTPLLNAAAELEILLQA